MTTELTPEEREELRMVVLGYLAPRNPGAFTPAQIAPILRRRRAVDFPFTDQDVLCALSFISDKKWAVCMASDFGLSQAFRATADGILEAERRGLC
jgi:hypothetical protein